MRNFGVTATNKNVTEHKTHGLVKINTTLNYLDQQVLGKTERHGFCSKLPVLLLSTAANHILKKSLCYIAEAVSDL